MKIKERKICSFTQKGTRIQLIELIIINGGITTNTNGDPMCFDKFKYQVRKNRERIFTSIDLSSAKSCFLSLCRDVILQLSLFSSSLCEAENDETT